jgi:hypothetical protein
VGSAQQGDQERHTSAGTTSTWERRTGAGAARERRTSGSAGARREEVRWRREGLGTYLTHRTSPWSELGTDFVKAERPGAAHGRGTTTRSRARADLRGGRLESRRQSRRDQGAEAARSGRQRSHESGARSGDQAGHAGRRQPEPGKAGAKTEGGKSSAGRSFLLFGRADFSRSRAAASPK